MNKQYDLFGGSNEENASERAGSISITSKDDKTMEKRAEQTTHFVTSYDHTKLTNMPKTTLEKQLLVQDDLDCVVEVPDNSQVIVSPSLRSTMEVEGIDQNPCTLAYANQRRLEGGLQDVLEATMTVKEAAKALGISHDVINRKIHELFPGKIKNGVITKLNEAEVTAIKLRLTQNPHLATYANQRRLVDMPKTKLEKQLLIRQAMQLQNEMIAELEAENEQLKLENAEAKPKVEYYDALVDKSAATSFRDTAKELGIPERKFIEALLADRYVYRNQKRKLNAYAQFIQEGLFTVKEWQAADRTGVQTLITVKGKELFMKKYKHLQSI